MTNSACFCDCCVWIVYIGLLWIDWFAESLNQCKFSTFTFFFFSLSPWRYKEWFRSGRWPLSSVRQHAVITSNKILRMRRLVHLTINTLNYLPLIYKFELQTDIKARTVLLLQSTCIYCKRLWIRTTVTRLLNNLLDHSVTTYDIHTRAIYLCTLYMYSSDLNCRTLRSALYSTIFVCSSD